MRSLCNPRHWLADTAIFSRVSCRMFQLRVSIVLDTMIHGNILVLKSIKRIQNKYVSARLQLPAKAPGGMAHTEAVEPDEAKWPPDGGH